MFSPSRQRLGSEFLLLFVGLPLVVWWQGELLRPYVVPLIALSAFGCAVALWRDRSFEAHCLLHLPTACRRHLGRISLLFAGGALLILGGTAWAAEHALFDLPRRQTTLWLMLLWSYPLFSVSAQEVVFRVFLFHRYRRLFRNRSRLVLAGAAAFAGAHAVYGNWLAPLAAFAGGLLFSFTYLRTRSLPLVVLEHALWGNWLFTVGLGRYFGGG